MDERTVARLGAPDLRLAGVQLWAHGDKFPDAEDARDANWRRVTALCSSSGASVWAAGALLDTVGVLRFRRGLASLYATLGSEAALASHEPNLVVRVNPAN